VREATRKKHRHGTIGLIFAHDSECLLMAVTARLWACLASSAAAAGSNYVHQHGWRLERRPAARPGAQRHSARGLSARGIFAVCALLLAFTADLRASLLRDPFGGDSVDQRDVFDGIAAIWHDELARIAMDQEAVDACAGNPLPAALKLIAIVKEARSYQGRALLGHINRAINLLPVRRFHRRGPDDEREGVYALSVQTF
jgi:hypothetical protein